MGLNLEDQEKVPADLTARDSYERIWEWHRAHGETVASERLDGPALDRYLAILPELPTVQDASDEDLAFLLHEVLTGTFEWSYHEEDGQGIKIAAYAFHAVDTSYGGDLSAVANAASRSELTRLKS
jgi:hypothetical protein